MKNELLHVFRNTPFGREMFLQSLYVCKMTNLSARVFIPEHPQFLMYFPGDVVTIDLDKSFLRFPQTAREHVEELARNHGVEVNFLKPKRFTASTLPDIPVNFGFMVCPRTISDLSNKVGLGYIGPRVRSIVNQAEFPVLIPSPAFKEWKSIVVFFGGSKNAVNACRLGLSLSESSGLPVRLFTHAKRKPRNHYEDILRSNGLIDAFADQTNWTFVDKGSFREALYGVAHDALVVVGAYGHNLAKDFLFGSTMEEVQSVLPNNMVIVGPNYQA